MQIPGHPDIPTKELLKALDNCSTIGQVFSFVQHTGVKIQMKSQQSASSLPRKQLPPIPSQMPLESLKAQVKDAILEAERRNSKEDLLKEIDKCNTIVQIFQLVERNNIVIRMRSQQSASCLPKKQVPLIPDKSPLESLKEQVKDAVMNGG